MNRSELIDQIARDADITETDVGKILKSLETRTKVRMDAGERVMLRGLCSFSRGEPSQKAGRNPRTGQPLTYTAYHRTTNAPSCSESKLCGEVASDTGLAESAVKRALDAFKATLKGALKKGGMVSLNGFGSFYVGKRAARNGRNPQTGATIQIAAAQVPCFRASKAGNRGGKFSAGSALKAAVN